MTQPPPIEFSMTNTGLVTLTLDRKDLHLILFAFSAALLTSKTMGDTERVVEIGYLLKRLETAVEQFGDIV